jgi:glycogen phosphorylase
MSNLLPRHMRIIYDINYHWMKKVGETWPNDIQKLQILSIIDEDSPKYVRMSHLAIVGSHHVNGVAKIHTEILKKSVFRDFVHIFPGKFSNKTNGVTPRRWVNFF